MIELAGDCQPRRYQQAKDRGIQMFSFMTGCVVGFGINSFLKSFAASYPETVAAMKTKAEAKAIDLINRILK